MVGEVRDGLLVLLVGVLCVMLVATANVANLVLAQGIERRDELAMRATLGAGGGRLVRLLAAEAGVLALGAGALGVGLAVGATRVLVALAPATTPRLASIRIDATVLAFTLLLALGSALVFGLVPALRLALDSDGRGLVVSRRGTSRSPERARGLLLVAEVAVSLVLLVAAGLLLRSFQELVGVRLGFDPGGVTSAFFVLPESRYDHPEKVAAFFAELEPRLLALPGVTSVGSILGTPFGRNQISASVEWGDRPAPPPGQEESVAMKVVSPGYFETLRIPLVAGRGLSGSDRHGARPVVLVNEAFARRYHPDGEAIGTVLRLGVDFGWAYDGFEVVGVVADARSTLLGPVLPEIFIPQAQMAAPWLTVLARSAPGVDLLPVLEATVAKLDPDLPLHRVEPLAVKIERQRGPSLLYLTLVGAFAAIALLLAAVGLYGVVAYVVSRRTREIAIRIAVGAEPMRILVLVVRQGMAPVLAGLAAGLLGSLLVRRLLDSLLYNAAAIDGLVLASVSLLLLGVAAAATAVPALRASRLAPAQALAAD
jgi:predicted permease